MHTHLKCVQVSIPEKLVSSLHPVGAATSPTVGMPVWCTCDLRSQSRLLCYVRVVSLVQLWQRRILLLVSEHSAAILLGRLGGPYSSGLVGTA